MNPNANAEKEQQRAHLRWFSAVCAHCGTTRGRHRWGDDACPNEKWAAGNGQSQWAAGTKFAERVTP